MFNNYFIFIKDNNIHTPIPDCFLNGITRQTVIEMATNQGFKITEKHIMPDEIGKYDEAFLTGTAAEVTPVSCIAENKFKVCKMIIDLNEIYKILVKKKKAA